MNEKTEERTPEKECHWAYLVECHDQKQERAIQMAQEIWMRRCAGGVEPKSEIAVVELFDSCLGFIERSLAWRNENMADFENNAAK